MKKTLNIILAILYFCINSATAGEKFISLVNFTNHDGAKALGKSYANLPREQKLFSVTNNTPFIINQNTSGNIFVVASGYSSLTNLPDLINIPVNDYAKKINFFGQIHFGVPNNRIIGKYTINFEDTTTIDVILDNEQTSPQWNIDDHCCNWRAKNITKASLAWEDTSQSEKRTLLREFVWDNPAPSKKIASIDFVSFKTSTSPVLAAITYFTPDNISPESCQVTINSNLDIHIPSATYQSLLGSVNLWADMEYVGQNANGELLWRLKNYGSLNQ